MSKEPGKPDIVTNEEQMHDLKMHKHTARWGYQEWWLTWTLWGIGWQYMSFNGWQSDELTILIGPVNISFSRG